MSKHYYQLACKVNSRTLNLLSMIPIKTKIAWYRLKVPVENAFIGFTFIEVDVLQSPIHAKTTIEKQDSAYIATQATN